MPNKVTTRDSTPEISSLRKHSLPRLNGNETPTGLTLSVAERLPFCCWRG